MTTPHREQGTIDAIQRLQDDYPFATGLLIYCLIERMLKYFVINEIDNTQSILNIRLCYPLRGVSKEELRNKIKDLSIEKIAKNFDKNKAPNEANFFKNIANRRNDCMHSNNLLPPDVKDDKEERNKDHKKYLRSAVNDLIGTFNNLKQGYEILIDKDERICGIQPQ